MQKHLFLLTELPSINLTKGASMDNQQWKSTKGTGWLTLEGFGKIAVQQDNVGDAGRHYFTAKTIDDAYAAATGKDITGGPQSWHYMPDSPFYLKDLAGNCIELDISVLPGSVANVRYRESTWPDDGSAW